MCWTPAVSSVWLSASPDLCSSCLTEDVFNSAHPEEFAVRQDCLWTIFAHFHFEGLLRLDCVQFTLCVRIGSVVLQLLSWASGDGCPWWNPLGPFGSWRLLFTPWISSVKLRPVWAFRDHVRLLLVSSCWALTLPTCFTSYIPPVDGWKKQEILIYSNSWIVGISVVVSYINNSNFLLIFFLHITTNWSKAGVFQWFCCKAENWTCSYQQDYTHMFLFLVRMQLGSYKWSQKTWHTDATPYYREKQTFVTSQ